MFPSSSGLNYTYSVVHEEPLHQYEIVVYLKPKDILKINQTEIGRVILSDLDVIAAQTAGQFQNTVQLHVANLVKTYESALNAASLKELTKDITLDPDKDDGIPYFESYKQMIVNQAAQETNAELAGYLNALGIDVSSGIPTDHVTKALVIKAAQLKKAQMENDSKAAFLAVELDAMKQSYKESAKVYKQNEEKYKSKTYPSTSYTAATYGTKLKNIQKPEPDDYDDWDDEPVYHEPVKTKTKISRPQGTVNIAFAEHERKFRD